MLLTVSTHEAARTLLETFPVFSLDFTSTEMEML